MRRLAWVTAGAAAVVAVAVVATVALTAPRSGGATPPGATATQVSPGSTSPGAKPTKGTGAASMQVEFSDPWSHSTAAQYRLHRTQIAAIDAAPKGATIHLVMYTLATETVGRALLNAYRRGVNVRMIIDDHENYRWTKRLQRAIGTDQRHGSYVVRCHLACASDITYPRRRSQGTIRPYVHAKWLLVDRSGSNRYVSMIPSENLTPAATQQSNDMLVLRGDKPIYDFLLARFNIMKKDSGSAYGTVSAGTLTMTMFPMPLPAGYTIDPDSPVPASMDPYLDYLRDIQCGGDHSTTIRIAMYMWTYPRLEVAKRFAELARAGCTVVAIGQPLSPERDEGWDPEITRALVDGGVQLHQTAGGGIYLHSKIVTLDGWTTEGARLKLAITGSSNFLLQALVASDDLVVTNSDPAVVDAYSAHVDQLIAHHSRPAK
jgi:phosphatidylserine/phosphatidylglycerophosphate/cardiolipin synthase-like enzyme